MEQNKEQGDTRVDVSAQPDRPSGSTGSTAPDDGGPAFPHHRVRITGACISGEEHVGGMSLRDYFAGQALNGMLAAPSEGAVFDPATIFQTFAEEAYAYADAMLEARKVGR